MVFLALARVTVRNGDPEFYGELLKILGKRLGKDLSMVMRYLRRNASEYLIHEGLELKHMDMHLRGLYRVDPIYRLCRGQGVNDLASVSAPAERSGDYFNICG